MIDKKDLTPGWYWVDTYRIPRKQNIRVIFLITVCGDHLWVSSGIEDKDCILLQDSKSVFIEKIETEESLPYLISKERD